MNPYKFNPQDHGYEPISNYPELSYNFPFPYAKKYWFIKVVEYGDHGGLVYWYSAIRRPLNDDSDDRITIMSGAHDTRKGCTNEDQGSPRTEYMGLISSPEFARELLIHILGTTKNDSVQTHGVQRHDENKGPKMREKFQLTPTNNK